MNLRETQRQPLDIPLQKILPPELPARSQMDEAKLEELAGNIARNGVLQRLIVVQVPGEPPPASESPDSAGQRADYALDVRYEVVAGHRRLLAAQRAGLVVVPCDVYATKEAALEAVKYAENRFREDMTPAEEAEYFAELFERQCDHDIEKVAALVGEKVGYIDNRLQLFFGDAEVFAAVKDRKISLGVAQQLNQIPKEDYRRYYLNHAIRGGATVAVVSGWVQEWKTLYAHQQQTPVQPTPLGGAAPVTTYDPLRCYICGKSDARHIPESVSIHGHCKLAILDPMLDAYHGAPARGEET